MEKYFTISVIISVLNTVRDLEDTIRSILYQTMDFEQKIQLIIVNGSSGDICEEVCKKYKALYPENIIYLCLDGQTGENAGRIAGMKYAVGKYITFLHAGSMWSLNAFERAADFFETCGEDIDLVSADTELIEAVNEKIPFNQKLTEHKIIDINEQYSDILYRSSSCIMRTKTVQKYSWGEHQGRWGDLLLIHQVLLRRQKYGRLSAEVLHYCHKGVGQDAVLEPDCGGELKELSNGIYQESMKRSGCILPMVQYLLACVLGECFQQTTVLSGDERQKCFDSVLTDLLLQIEDQYLLETENVDRVVQKVLAAYKHGVDIRDEIGWMRKMERQYQDLCRYFDKTNRNYGVLKEWFLSHIQGKRVSDFFERNHYQKIAVYGMAELGQFLVLELRDSGFDVKYGIDRRAGAIAAGIPVLTLEHELPLVDVVIVTAVYFFNQIADSLTDRLECPVISIEDVLYSIP